MTADAYASLQASIQVIESGRDGESLEQKEDLISKGQIWSSF